jgi:O-antigen/teichoic acid export membrane protein
MANWIGYGANLLVMFFLSPFVVHSLGDSTYGVWSLLVSLTGYMGLVELGTRGGLDRFINFYLGKNNHQSVNGVVNTGLVMFLFIGLVLVAVASILACFFGTFFSKTPVELLGVARITVILVAINLWLIFISAPFFQILTAFERFDLLNAINLVSLAIRAVLTVVVLKNGCGIVALAVIQAIATLIGLLATFYLSKRIYPQLVINLSLASRFHFRELFTFSLWGFVSSVGMQLLYWTDNVVIAVLLGPEMVTYYSIAGMLVIYSRGIVEQCSRLFVPQMIKSIAKEDWDSVRKIFLNGSNLIMAVGIPLLTGIAVFGKQFISLWMGPVYGTESYQVLMILACSQFFPFAILLGGAVINGLNKVRYGALMTFGQAVTNLILSVILVKYYSMGIEGVAWGTFYPRLVFTIFMHGVILKWIGLPWDSFLRATVSRWAFIIIGFTAISLTILNIDSSQNGWNYLGTRILLSSLLYVPLCWYVLLEKSTRGNLLSSVKLRWHEN